MRAAVLTEVGSPLEILELTPVDLGSRDVRVRIEASGVCHSDLSLATGVVPMPPPAILGHEGTGTVIEIGDQVGRVAVGDRVIGSFVPACGDCFYCVRGQSNLCEQLFTIAMRTCARNAEGARVYAMSGLGTFADEMVVHEWSVVRVETDLPPEQLALIGCGVTTGVGAVLNTAQVPAGASVAVIGCGGVGQSVIQAAQISGAAIVIAIDPVELKRTTALELGATHAVDPQAGDLATQVRELTDGRGADYVFEVVGRPETIVAARDCARLGGTVTIVGMPRFDAEVTFPAYGLFFDEKRMLGSNYGSANVRRDFPRFVRLVESGQLDLADMVTRTIRLDEVNDAFTAMQAGDVIRSVIIPD